jgi:hypothetical protein
MENDATGPKMLDSIRLLLERMDQNKIATQNIFNQAKHMLKKLDELEKELNSLDDSRIKVTFDLLSLKFGSQTTSHCLVWFFDWSPDSKAQELAERVRRHWFVIDGRDCFSTRGIMALEDLENHARCLKKQNQETNKSIAELEAGKNERFDRVKTLTDDLNEES